MIIIVVIHLEKALRTALSRDKRTIRFGKTGSWQDDVDVFVPIKQLMIKGDDGLISE